MSTLGFAGYGKSFVIYLTFEKTLLESVHQWSEISDKAFKQTDFFREENVVCQGKKEYKIIFCHVTHAWNPFALCKCLPLSRHYSCCVVLAFVDLGNRLSFCFHTA